MKEDIFNKAQRIKNEINHCNSNINVLEKIIDYWEKNNITVNNDALKKVKNLNILNLLDIVPIFQFLIIMLIFKSQI